MIETFKVLEVTCPSCGAVKNINIPEAIFTQKKFGTVKIQVPINAVCPDHQFIVFVDTKGIIRGYEKIDIQMVTLAPEAEMEGERRLNLRTLIQIFGIYGVFSLIHTKVFNYPAYIIKDENFEFSEDTLNFVGDLILPDNLRGNKTIHLLEEPNISKIKVKEKNVLIMDTNQHIFQTPWSEKLKFEEGIIKRALKIIDEQGQLKLLQQDIARLINEVNHSIAILEDIKEIYEDDLIEEISRKVKTKKISNYRLNLIKEYIKQNISEKIASKIKNKVEEFLGLI